MLFNETVKPEIAIQGTDELKESDILCRSSIKVVGNCFTDVLNSNDGYVITTLF